MASSVAINARRAQAALRLEAAQKTLKADFAPPTTARDPELSRVQEMESLADFLEVLAATSNEKTAQVDLLTQQLADKSQELTELEIKTISLEDTVSELREKLAVAEAAPMPAQKPAKPAK